MSIIEISPGKSEPKPKLKLLLKKKTEVDKHIDNIRPILQHSNATPIGRYGGIGYTCYFCKAQYALPRELKTHTLTHHDKTKSIFTIKRSMLTYIVKLDITDLKCELCDTNIDSLDQLIEHLKSIHKKVFHDDIKSHVVPFKFGDELNCVICGKDFNNFKILLEHMNTHFGNYVCDTCGSGFVNKRILQTHMYRHRTGVFHCTFCSKVFDTRIKQKDHERAVHICHNKRNKCGYCGEMFTDYTKKNDHEVKIHGAKALVLKCQACDKVFDNQRALTVHTKAFHLMERRLVK